VLHVQWRAFGPLRRFCTGLTWPGATWVGPTHAGLESKNIAVRASKKTRGLVWAGAVPVMC